MKQQINTEDSASTSVKLIQQKGARCLFNSSTWGEDELFQNCNWKYLTGYTTTPTRFYYDDGYIKDWDILFYKVPGEYEPKSVPFNDLVVFAIQKRKYYKTSGVTLFFKDIVTGCTYYLSKDEHNEADGLNEFGEIERIYAYLMDAEEMELLRDECLQYVNSRNMKLKILLKDF